VSTERPILALLALREFPTHAPLVHRRERRHIVQLCPKGSVGWMLNVHRKGLRLVISRERGDIGLVADGNATLFFATP
jgi:hypothetical protein